MEHHLSLYTCDKSVAYLNSSIGSYGHIRSDVWEGLHSVTCEVMEETDDPGGSRHVRIIAVLAA